MAEYRRGIFELRERLYMWKLDFVPDDPKGKRKIGR
jgi:hypothetical protein